MAHQLQTRRPFDSQAACALLIDLNAISSTALPKITTALRNILALSCSMVSSPRIPAFGVATLSDTYKTIFPLSRPIKEFKNISRALSYITCQTSQACTLQLYKDVMREAITATLDECKGLRLKSSNQIEIVIISAKDCQVVRDTLCEIVKTVELVNLRKIRLVEIQTAFNLHSQRLMVNTCGYFIEVQRVDESEMAFEEIFKEWLVDQYSGPFAIIHFPGSIGSRMDLYCTFRECIVDPSLLPHGLRCTIQTDSLATRQTISESRQLPIYEFNVVGRISMSEMDETYVFGQPMIVLPAKSWPSAEAEGNEERFRATCRHLSRQSYCLLIRMESSYVTDIFLPYFILEAEENIMLMKSFATREISLPHTIKTNSLDISEQNNAMALASISNVKVFHHPELKTLKSGMYQSLISGLMSSKHSYP